MLCFLFVFHFVFGFFFFKQKTAYEMRISDWSSDVCSSDLFFPRRQADKICAYRFALSWRDRLDVDRDPLEGPPADRHLDPGGHNRIPDAPAPAGREQSTQPPFSCGSGTGARPPHRLSVELDGQFALTSRGDG